MKKGIDELSASRVWHQQLELGKVNVKELQCFLK